MGGNGTVVGTRSGSLPPGAAASSVGQCPISAGGTPPGCGGYCRFRAPHKNQIRGSLIITPMTTKARPWRSRHNRRETPGPSPWSCSIRSSSYLNGVARLRVAVGAAEVEEVVVEKRQGGLTDRRTD